MRSLRARLGLAAGLATGSLVLVASVSVVRQQWLRADAVLPGEATALAELADRNVAKSYDDSSTLDLGEPPPGGFVAAFDSHGKVLDARGGTQAAIDEAAGTVRLTTVGQYNLVGGELQADDEGWVVSAIGCSVPAACATIVVGWPRTDLGAYLVSRLGWVLGLSATIGLLAALSARRVVGMSLRPVDRMRAELDDITSEHLDRRVAAPSTGDELQWLGESLNRGIERLAAAVDAQRRFSSDAAHELRNPIAGVRATLEVGRANPEALDRAVVDSLAQLDRTTRLLDDLLVLARRDGAPAALDLHTTDLDDLVAEQARELRLRRPECNLDCRQVEPVQVEVDRMAMRRVIGNLLDNAADHARTFVRVKLSWVTPDTWQLSVDDDGPGVPAEHRLRIFERFARMDDSRTPSAGGSGLGLAIVKELVELHGGAVEVTDSDLGGASVVVTVGRSPKSTSTLTRTSSR